LAIVLFIVTGVDSENSPAVVSDFLFSFPMPNFPFVASIVGDTQPGDNIKTFLL
jgi:hypothetical protein